MKGRLKHVAIQSVVWTLAFVFWGMARQFGQEIVDGPPARNLLGHAFFYIALGIMVATIFSFTGELLDKRLKLIKSFGVAILVNTVLYLLIFFIVITLGVTYYTLFDDGPSNWTIVVNYIFSKEGGLLLFYFFFILLLINFVKQVDKKFGPQNLLRMIRGDFYRPQEMERIVMFLDLKSSTTIAEEIGHIKFSRFLQDCFDDLNIIRKYDAEIYQYVGDEVVLIWEVPKGIRDSNCVEFYFAYSEILTMKSDYYQREYGVSPQFKCGCHVGNVVMTEIGQIKREIAYLGDVMNTAARIQGLCNENNKVFLLSEDLFKMLPSTTSYQYQFLNKIALKGKVNDVNIYSVEKASSG